MKDRARPISVEFVRKEDVKFILANKTNLSKSVYADKEYPAEIEKKRKILRLIFTAAKHNKKYKKHCRMENDVLVIKEKKYNVNELDKLPKSLKPINVTSRTNATVFGYFGELNPLSNFFPSPFTYEEKSFHCSEQFIQLKKVELFKDNAAVRRIEQTTNGHQCKQEGQKYQTSTIQSRRKMPTNSANLELGRNSLTMKCLTAYYSTKPKVNASLNAPKIVYGAVACQSIMKNV